VISQFFTLTDSSTAHCRPLPLIEISEISLISVLLYL